MQVGVRLCEAEFLAVAAADAELVDAPVAEQVVCAAHDARVAELRTEVVVAQVGVGVKMDDMQAGMPPDHRT